MKLWGIPLTLTARGYAAIPVGTPVQRLRKPGWFRRIFSPAPVPLREDEPNGTPWRDRLPLIDVYAVRFPEGDPAYTAIRKAMQGL